MACGKVLLEIIKWETQERLTKEKEEHLKARMMQKYGQSIEMEIRKELDMEVPELSVKTDVVGGQLSLK